MATFAVFGDVHGRVALMITLALQWQRSTGRSLDAILQVGDMGAFPDHGKLDSSTARFAKHDLDELGYLDFITETPDSLALLEPAECPPVVFCRGNHEDFDYLGAMRTPQTVDPFGKLWFVPDGNTFTLNTPTGPVVLGALGGAPPLRDDQGRGRKARDARRRKQRRSSAVGPLGKRFTEQQAQNAFRTHSGPIHLLMTHAGPRHDQLVGGCEHLERLAARVAPAAHLFGHHHQVVGPVPTASGLLVGLEHLEFTRSGALKPGAWGILELEDGVDFTRAESGGLAWLSSVTRHSWRALFTGHAAR